MRITFFPNGSTMAFENEKQVPIAQKSWLMLFVEYLLSQDIDPAEQEFVMPDGQQVRILRFEDDGKTVYNWEVIGYVN